MYATKKLGLIKFKRYWRYAGKDEIEQDWLYDTISVLVIFVKHLHSVYDNEKVTKNMKVK